jgi:transcriptional regulator with XRE-family HTH domain
MAQKPRTVTDRERYMGERIREARLSNGLSQRALGELLGVSFQAVQKYETGETRLNSGRIELLMTALNRPFAYFFPSTDIRGRVDPEINNLLSTKEGLTLASVFARLTTEDQRLILHHATRLAAKETA